MSAPDERAPREDSRLAFLRELARADEAVAATLAELDELAAESERLRTRAVDLETLELRLPAERERARVALEAAEREAGERRAALEAAERELEEADRTRDAERRAAARRGHVRARDALRMAERRVDEARAEGERVERDAEAVRTETPVLEARAGELAGALRGRQRLAEQAGAEPAPGLAGVAAWGSNARAALFVARSGLAAERETLIRQANELGAVVLGEPLSAVGAAAVARRVEEAGPPA